MTEFPAYRRLERAIRLIARHPYFPGKNEAVHECLADLEERCRLGTLTLDQKARLIAIFVDEGGVEGIALGEAATRGEGRP